LLALFAALLSALLWPAWTGNPDLSHGLFMPLAFGFLLWEARSGPARYLAARQSACLTGVLSVAGLVVLSLAGLYASVVDWSHALVEFSLCSALALLIAAGLATLSDDRVRLIPFNWTAWVSAGLWILSSPIPPGAYNRLAVGLQLWVSTNVVHALHLLGVAAGQTGNVIRLANTTVGVEEACSGIRSLVSCIYCGFFFSATLVRKPWARLAIIALSAPLALGMNFLRSLALTLLANDGVSIAGVIHDATGFAILGITAVLLGALALWLERTAGTHSKSKAPAAALLISESEPPPVPIAEYRPWRGALLAAPLLIAAALIGIFFANTRPSVNRDRQPPDLLAVLPESSSGWSVSTDRTLYQFQDTLKTDHLAQRVYRRSGPDGLVEVIVYVAYWSPGQVPVSLVASHTPDACWPGSGWVLEPPPEMLEAAPSIDGRPLADAQARFFRNQGARQYVWFWHLYDGRPIPYTDPYSVRRLLGIALKYGFRHEGDQLFVRVSSNRPWSVIQNDGPVREFFERVRPLGL
jgi:exosortase